MPTPVVAHTAFISSPSDVAAERNIVPRVVTELNNVYLQATGQILWPLMWETMLGGIGEDVQAVINRQTPNYDIFVGIMWSRFGTPTLRAGSGTEEEFDRAFELHVSQKAQIDFMVFVKTAAFPHSIDEGQLRGVRRFVDKLRARGILHHAFEDASEFEVLLRRHLLQYVASRTTRAPVAAHLSEIQQKSPVFDGKPYRALAANIVQFSERLKQAVDFIVSKDKARLDQGRRLLRDATVSLVTDASANIKKLIDWTYVYGRTCYSQTQPPCDEQARTITVSELESVAEQISDWRSLIGAAPSGDPSISGDFALAREFLDHCVCVVQTSAYGLSKRRIS